MTAIEKLNEMGQSIWLNYLRRSFIEYGELSTVVAGGIRGITSTPTLFEKAILCSSEYDEALKELVAQGKPVREIYEALVADDVQRAADLLLPVQEQSGGLDGYVTIELDPSLAYDIVGTIAEARHVLHQVNRRNVMVEIPTTRQGIEAMELLVGDGVNVNMTHIFSAELYGRVADAYLRGISDYIASHSVWRQYPTVVASFSISRIDRSVDNMLLEAGHPELRGKAAIAAAKLAYERQMQIMSSDAWAELAEKGAHPMRLKWTRTTARNFHYPDTYYVEALMGPGTVMTLSPQTYHALLRGGQVEERLGRDVKQAHETIRRLSELGINLDQIGVELQMESLAVFDSYFQALITSVIKKRNELDYRWKRMEMFLGSYREPIKDAMIDLCEHDVPCRIWAHDHTVWQPDPAEIENRLGWLHVVETMRENIDDLKSFFDGVRRAGFEDAIVLGMGGSSLAPELFAKVFGQWAMSSETPALRVLDTTDPDAVSALETGLDLPHTLFIVSSKSGTTIETLSAFRYFYNRLLDTVGDEQAGAHFVAITDPGTSLYDLAIELGFRRVFANDPNIGGRYSALSYFGLVPAALTGLDLDKLLDRAEAMVCNAHGCTCSPDGDSHAAHIGTVMGRLALEGRDKLTIVASPALAPFADWVEQLVAESTGKDGRGIVPIIHEPLGLPDAYGNDRFFVYLRLDGDSSYDSGVSALLHSGQPVVTLHLKDIYDIGGLFFLWEMATAVAAHHLRVQPFNQPDVEAAKRLARQMAAAYQAGGKIDSAQAVAPDAAALKQFMDKAHPGDYVAFQAFVKGDKSTDRLLKELRVAVRDRTGLATTAAYGPRYLHSTGQLHKGGPNKGLFVQLLSQAENDLPIPDAPGKRDSTLTFGTLKKAQAAGDAQALRDVRRRVICFDLGKEIEKGLTALLEIRNS